MGQFIPQHSLKPFSFVFTTPFSLPPTFALHLYESHLLLFQLSYTKMRSSIYFLLALISSPALAAPTFVLKRYEPEEYPSSGQLGPVDPLLVPPSQPIINRTSIPSSSFPLKGAKHTPNF
ncbi:hypothetical protein BC827DRAFT_1245583 [Russula dissimulans]|nr:hypothetical protein BC827DRAFT_1245583 [Russula dissimulans]